MCLLIGLTACDNNEYTNTRSRSCNPVNLIMANDGTSIISSGSVYGFTLKFGYNGQEGTFNINNLVINNNSINFETEEQSYATSNSLQEAYFTNLVSDTPNVSISNSTFLITPFLYDLKFNNEKEMTLVYTGQDFVVAQYTLNNNYTIKTIPPVTVWAGTTTSSYYNGGEEIKFPTNTIYYSIQINFDESGKPTGELNMYNAKFTENPREPVKTQIKVEGLEVSYENGALTLSGENIEPLLPDGTNWTPNPNYIFNSINFQTTSPNLMNGHLDFQVAGMYNGSFDGSYADSYFNK